MLKKYLVSALIAIGVIWLTSAQVKILPGRLRADVGIYRDEQGVARVTAHSLPDLCYGVGAAMARDRLWNLLTLKKRL